MANGGIIGPTNPVGAIVQPKVSVFTATGTLTTTAGTSKVDATVIAGGGAGGADRAGGGGAGGYRTFTCQSVCGSAPYTVTVGGGGAGGSGNGTSGSDSSLVVGGCITQTSAGGGRGGSDRGLPSGDSTGASGGSGGGGGQCQPGGAGNTPPVAPPQGNTGGNATPSVGGGGGGSGGTGFPGTTACNQSKAGTGSSLESYLSSYGGAINPASPAGVLTLIAGGGGGGNPSPNNVGFGGGTPGGRPGTANACAALGASGGGGGGGGPGSPPGACAQGGDGGSGLVVVKEKGSVTKVSGMWSMQDQYDESLAGNWSFASPFGDVNILTIGGGGGGAYGAGGAGGYQFNTALTLGTGVTYTATIGAGGISGAPGRPPPNSQAPGVNTTFSGPDIQTMTAYGGGRAKSAGTDPVGSQNGGSGGGSNYHSPANPEPAGSGNTPVTFMSQGNPGACGTVSDNSATGGGGGAGAAAAFVPLGPPGAGSCMVGGAGGAGSSGWPGDCTLRAGGGGGAGGPGGGAGGPGGALCAPTLGGVAGTVNTGGGGGGGSYPWTCPGPCGGQGGSGVIIIQYPGGPRASGGTITPVPGCKTQHLFNATGCFVT
jgi:hypothetical protein